LIIHAGDICDEGLFKKIQSLNNVKAVCGNMDNATLRKKLSSKLIFKCEEVMIGVIHGDRSEDQLLAYIQKVFTGERLDIVIFGHSHTPFNQKIDGVLYFNPGSPNDEVFSPYCSYGLLEINGSRITSKIIKVE